MLFRHVWHTVRVACRTASPSVSLVPRRSMRTAAPYGSWTSPITTDVITKSGTVLGELAAYGSWAVYTITKPEDRGRTSLACKDSHDPNAPEVICTTETLGSVRSSVHEYGGGAFAVSPQGYAVFTHQAQRAFGVSIMDMRTKQVKNLVPLTPMKRYADFGPHPTDATFMVAVEEDHSNPQPKEVRNRLVCFSGSSVHVLDESHDFYAYPRISPDGSMVAWVTWDHPSMPFWSSQLWVASILPGPSPRLSAPHCIAGGSGIVAQQPIWVHGEKSTLLYTQTQANDADIYEVRLTSHHDSIQICQLNRVASKPLPPQRDVQPPLWNLNISSMVTLSHRHIVYVESADAQDSLVLLDRGTKMRTYLDLPWTQFSQLRVSSSHLLCLASNATSQTTMLSIDMSKAMQGLSNMPSVQILRSVAETPIPESYISVPEPISFPTQLPNGQESLAHGLYYPPTNPAFEGPSGTLPPCRIMAHSGPTSRAASVLDLSVQYWTTRGWAVCLVNFGGSTGYGYEYMQRLNGHWGDMDVRDCVAAAAYLGGNDPPWTMTGKSSTPPRGLEERNDPDGTRIMTFYRTEPSSHVTDLWIPTFVGFLGYGLLYALNPFVGLSTMGLMAASSTISLGLYLYRILFRIQSESIRVMPGLGVQLETNRGLSLAPRTRGYLEVSTSRTFIPRDTILDFFMLEVLQWWKVQDYAVLATSSATKKEGLKIVFPSLLPRREVYLYTYRRLYHTMLGTTSSTKPLPRVDATKICLSGRSSGGYTVLCAVTSYPGVFCAAASTYGIADIFSMAEETHKFELHYTSGLIGGTQDEIPDVYKARSAIYHADSIRTPLLLMHGDQDNVVAPSQSRSMAKTIEQNGGCVRYIEYEGEGHGFRQVSTRCKALEAEFEFFQKAAHSVRSP